MIASLRRLLLIGALGATGAVAVLALRRATGGLEVDPCLDRGGKWDAPGRTCRPGGDRPAGRLVLRVSAARQLGLSGRTFVQVDSLRVPSAVRKQANELRGVLGGDTTAEVRYYVESSGQLAVLIPSRSFEGEDPHVVGGFGIDGTPLARVMLPSFGAAEVYCPASGQTHPQASSRDSTDWCRYFRPIIPFSSSKRDGG